MTSAGEARFAELYEGHYGKVAAYCRRRAHPDQVDDLTADVFATVWRKIDEAPEGEEALPWLYRIAYLTLSNHWRSRSRRRRLEAKIASLGLPVAASTHDQVVVREELREVLRAASRLRPEEQEILRLSLWEHLSHEDAGAVLGITPNAAKQRLHRARRSLVREHERLARRNRRQTPAAPKGGEW